MTVRIFDTEAQVGQAAATLIAAQVLEKKNTILGLATGSSPIGCYQQLIAWHKQGILDFSECRSFNLDEYCALDPTHPCSYHQFMQDELFSAINMKATAVPDGCAADLNAECARYDAAIRAAGGIDLQLLGLGRNGHIGFNEPAACFTKGTNIVTLTQSTLDANKRFFNSIDEVPKQAISMGIGIIMESRKIVLVAMGEEKADAVAKMVNGAVTPEVPASILQHHANVTILLDKKAASKL